MADHAGIDRNASAWTPPPLRFGLEEMERAADDWGANCGPGAIAAATVKTLDEVRPHIPGFEAKRYTNPTMMLDALNALGVRWKKAIRHNVWPNWGVARIQWEGPWTEPGRPARAAYRYTHWVAACGFPRPIHIFDINAIAVGGWVPLQHWEQVTVPWLLPQISPRATGWRITHALEIRPPDAADHPPSVFSP